MHEDDDGMASRARWTRDKGGHSTSAGNLLRFDFMSHHPDFPLVREIGGPALLGSVVFWSILLREKATTSSPA
jgi:hypothetical protein